MQGATNGAVDVDRFPAGAADHVVVMIPDPIFVAGRRTGRLDAPDEALLNQEAERVVNRLARDGSDIGTHILGDGVCRAVGATRNRSQHGQALGCNLDAAFAE